MPQPNQPTNPGPAERPCEPPEAPPDLSMRMAALAQVAGGVAPALNDLLTVITGRASLLLDRVETDADTRESLSEIYTAGERAVSLIRQLQFLGECEKPHTQAINVNQLVEESDSLLRRVLGAGIVLELRLAPAIPPAVADRSMLEEVLLGLVWNARDAMPRGGHLAVATAPVTIAADAVANYPDGRIGSFVSLSVADTGGGIPPEIRPRIFEPFFTTKAAGRGAGLGLSAIFGIMRQHQGWLSVDSVVGRGSTFTVFLPIATADTPSASVMPPTEKASGGRKAILLVDDDAPVREFTTAVLQSHGYRVLQAQGATEAFEVWKWHGARIGLLLTDIALEDMSGLDLAAKLRGERPELAVICLSGLGREIMDRTSPVPGGCLFLAKPCRPQALVRTVRSALDSTPT